MNETVNFTLRNLTPHSLAIYDEAGSLRATVPASGTVARVGEEVTREFEISTGAAVIPVRQIKAGQFEGIPDPADGVILIVSRVLADAYRSALHSGRAPLRQDIMCPGAAVRDEAGRQTGCTGLYWVR